MKKAETLKLLAMLSAFYGQGKADPEQMVSSWHMILKDYSYEEAENAIIAFAKMDCREYATFPAPGVLINQIEETRKKEHSIKCAAWINILNTDEYDQLIEEAKDWFSREQFTELKKMPYEIQLTQRDNFIKLIGETK